MAPWGPFLQAPPQKKIAGAPRVPLPQVQFSLAEHIVNMRVPRSDLRLPALVTPMGGVPPSPSHKVCEGVSGCELSTALGNQLLSGKLASDSESVPMPIYRTKSPPPTLEVGGGVGGG